MLKKVFFSIVMPLVITAACWLSLDAIVTHISGVRGFSMFFTTDEHAGHINKPNFTGVFGGFLDSFSARVSIGAMGERNSTKPECRDVRFVLFLGDSTTAGFEVDDSETFVSRINSDCKTAAMVGMNFGVRAYDSHEVLGNYMRISKSIRHNAVVYLITENDLSENMELEAYGDLVKKFGRVFNGQYYRPRVSTIEDIYMQFRIFVSDNFYMTSKALSMYELLRGRRNGPQIYAGIPKDQAETLVRLVTAIAAVAKSNGAVLYVASRPCLSLDPCAGPDVEKLLAQAEANSKDYTVLPLATGLEEKFRKGEIKRGDMRFYNDKHLSKYGHEIVAGELMRGMAGR